ncbi:MAG: hypothetical protein ABEJ74_08640 [Haloferacaceae archaeon]
MPAEEGPLPAPWVRDFEGQLSARYRREPVGVEVIVEPRYRMARGRPETRPSSFRVQLRRPFWNSNRVATELTVVDTFEEARAIARRYMETYDEHYRRVHDRGDEIRTREGDRDAKRTASAVAISAAGETAPYSNELLLEHLESLLDDGLHAVWHADAAGIDPVFVDDYLDVDEGRMRALTDALGTLDRDAVGDPLQEEVSCVTVSLEEYDLFQFVIDADHSTVVVADESRVAQLPNFTRETQAVLAKRTDAEHGEAGDGEAEDDEAGGET